jgi:pyridoxamine 5'-phosphate oxidase
MNDALFEPAPDFDQPIAVLKHCHDKIRKQLKTLERLIDYLPSHGASREAQQAAQAVLHYFDKAAQYHHADEEQDLLPMLMQVAKGEDAAALRGLLPSIELDHRKMEAAWFGLAQQLNAIAHEGATSLSGTAVREFNDMYTQHMTLEESAIAPMALRLFDAEQMTKLGESMRERRNQEPPAASPKLDLHDVRCDYRQAELSEHEVAHDPMIQFSAWFEAAQKAEVQEVNAMGLSTVARDGRPASRIVLLKEVDARGMVFFTNYQSRKGQELEHNQQAAILFFWPELERQVRIEGKIEKIDAASNDEYFAKRPLLSQLAAIASDQSLPIADRASMEQRLAQVSQQYGDHPVRPEQWGGYRLVPDYFEFWQGRRSRFHDRIVYQLQADGTWQRQRLQP